MKMKRILSLALLLGFLMIGGNALAWDTRVSDLAAGMIIPSKNPDGTLNFFEVNTGDSVEIKYLWPNNTELETIILNDATPSNNKIGILLFPTNVDWAGYRTDVWFVSEVEHHSNGSNHYDLTLKPAPHNYYIDYYDGNTWLVSQYTTIEEDAVFNSTASKNGYILKGWDWDPAGDTVRFGPGEEIAKAWLMSIENPSQANPVNLYAVWEKVEIAPPVDLPQTGDNSNVILWSALAFVSLFGMMLLVCKRKEA